MLLSDVIQVCSCAEPALYTPVRIMKEEKCLQVFRALACLVPVAVDIKILLNPISNFGNIAVKDLCGKVACE